MIRQSHADPAAIDYRHARGRHAFSVLGARACALDRFPARWHRIVDECLRIRRGQRSPSHWQSPLSRRREALAFVSMAMDDALGLDPGDTSNAAVV